MQSTIGEAVHDGNRDEHTLSSAQGPGREHGLRLRRQRVVAFPIVLWEARLVTKKVFISHVHVEKEIAIAFKELIEDAFLGMIETFVSSDGESIRMGRDWLREIDTALTDCVLEIILSSPTSVTRPWINFEAGAGWIRKIPVVPLCHAGLVRDNLPSPLGSLQSANATDESHLRLIFVELAQALGAKKTPDVDFSSFIAKVKEFEEKVTFWDKCLAELRLVRDQLGPDVLKQLAALPATAALTVTDTPQDVAHALAKAITFLPSKAILRLETSTDTGVRTVMRPGQGFITLIAVRLTRLSRFDEAMEHASSKL